MADEAITENITAHDADRTKKEGMKMATTKTAATKTSTTTKTTATRKAAAKTTTAAAAAKKTPAKKTTAAKVEVTLQWNGNDYTQERLLQSAKDVWTFDLGKDAADFKSAQIYVKPEEGKAYVVVNDSESLSFAI